MPNICRVVLPCRKDSCPLITWLLYSLSRLKIHVAEIPVSEIVAYANRLGNYTSAPPNFNPADPNQPFEPPYPREVSMRAGILNQQHVPAAALVSLDGGVMPGMAGQPIQPLVVPGESGEGVTPAGGIVSGVGAGAGVGGDAGVGAGVGGLMNGHMGMMPPHGLMDEDDYDSGSSSEDEGLSFYGRNKERQDQYQQQQQQQQEQQEPDDEDAADIFDLDLS